MFQLPAVDEADARGMFTATPFDDHDNYRGACGVEDTRQALIDA